MKNVLLTRKQLRELKFFENAKKLDHTLKFKNLELLCFMGELTLIFHPN